jgi:hypothetical protein
MDGRGEGFKVVVAADRNAARLSAQLDRLWPKHMYAAVAALVQSVILIRLNAPP